VQVKVEVQRSCREVAEKVQVQRCRGAEMCRDVQRKCMCRCAEVKRCRCRCK